MFDPNANPESVAARAAELALEQLARLRDALNDGKTGLEFYAQSFEVGTSNQIGKLMGGYAVLKGYVTEEQAAH